MKMETKLILMNKMREIRIEKLTLNIGAGKDQNVLSKGMKLIEQLTGIKPVKTKTQKRIPGWGLRPGLPIGVKLTIRGEAARKLIPRLLGAKSFNLIETNVDDAGNISFGVPEYIDIEGAKYDPEIGIFGLDVSAAIGRRGQRVQRRHMMKRKVPTHHRVSKDEGIDFVEKKFGVEVVD